MRSYHEYKIENHEWVKTIPSHWSFAKIAHFSDLRTGGTPRKNVLAYWENGTIPWMTSGEVNEKNIYKTKSHITESGLNNSNANLLPENSVMIALSGQGKTKATVAILKTIAACSQSLAAFVCNENRLHYRYLFYYLERNYKNIRGLVGDNLRDGLSLTKLREFRSPIPPFPEQCAIANFLDRKTAQIDTLIEKKQHQIELLHEHRTTLINQAVTKGLNPDTPMKDSGIEWVGIVPFHWKTTRIKFLANREKSSFIDGDWVESPYITDSGIRIIQTGNVGIGKYKEQGFRYISDQTFHELKCTEVYPNDVLICRLASPVGRACLAPDLEVRMITAVDNCILKPANSHDARYIVYQLSTTTYLEYLEYISRGSTRARISRSMLGNLAFIAPPLPEQRGIADFLDKKTVQIDNLSDRIQTQITYYQEYRTALISAAVTGKIDVRAEGY